MLNVLQGGDPSNISNGTVPREDYSFSLNHEYLPNNYTGDDGLFHSISSFVDQSHYSQ